MMDGEAPALSVDGGPALREALLPRADYEILDTWQVSGLRGSGSHDVVVRAVFVPEERMTGVMAGDMTLRETGTLIAGERLEERNEILHVPLAAAEADERAALVGVGATSLGVPAHDLLEGVEGAVVHVGGAARHIA